MQHDEAKIAQPAVPAPDADGTPETSQPMGFREFVAMMAAIMAMNALSIDPMLPSLPDIAKSLNIVAVTDRHWIITLYFCGFAFGSLFYGSLSDRYGRKIVLTITMGLFVLATAACAVSSSFTLMLIGRATAGFFAAAGRVVSVSIVRDRFQGDRMARIMSLIFLVFLVVPILAPAFGQAMAYLFGWRGIFWALVVVSSVIWAWMMLRLSETLRPENRIAINVPDIKAALTTIVTTRRSIGYMFATGIMLSALIGFLTSVQPILFDVFNAKGAFLYAFGTVAAFMGIGSFSNSRLVERIGARRLSHGALLAFIAISAIHTVVAWQGLETLYSFVGLQALSMLCFALSGSNFGSISMEPFARGAGLASSFQSCLTSLISSVLGAVIGSLYNGTTVPVALGFLIFGCITLLMVAWAENWRLFTRPGLAQLREPASLH